MHSAARLTPIGPLGLHTALSGLIVPAEGRSRTNNVQAAGAPHTAHRFLGTVRTAPLLAPLEPLMTTTAPHCVFRKSVTGDFGIVADDFGNVTGDFGAVTDGHSGVS